MHERERERERGGGGEGEEREEQGEKNGYHAIKCMHSVYIHKCR